MATELEQAIMEKIELGNHYSWFNGSGSCTHIRQDAVRKLPDIAKKYNLVISREWLEHCKTANKSLPLGGHNETLVPTPLTSG